jgi:hypothetical protein
MPTAPRAAHHDRHTFDRLTARIAHRAAQRVPGGEGELGHRHDTLAAFAGERLADAGQAGQGVAAARRVHQQARRRRWQ